MLREFKTEMAVCMIGGLALKLVGVAIMLGSDHEDAGVAVQCVGFLAFISGCGAWAQGKGYHRLWGALGVVSVVGLGILCLLPDRAKIRRVQLPPINWPTPAATKTKQ